MIPDFEPDTLQDNSKLTGDRGPSSTSTFCPGAAADSEKPAEPSWIGYVLKSIL
jgi:hypothetical protein